MMENERVRHRKNVKEDLGNKLNQRILKLFELCNYLGGKVRRRVYIFDRHL